MPSVPQAVTPRPRGLTLTTEEIRVLEAIDGARTTREVADAVGRHFDEITELIERLAMLGVVRFWDPSSATPPRSARPAALQDSAKSRKNSGNQAPLDHDEADDEALDLTKDERDYIDAMHVALHRLDFYSLLGVPRDADKKTIKRAYYRVGPAFHPDKRYGKSLGRFKSKIEAIFTRVTEAHDTLTRKIRRRDYDQSIGDMRTGGRRPEPPPGWLPEPTPSAAESSPASVSGAHDSLKGPAATAEPGADRPSWEGEAPASEAGAREARISEPGPDLRPPSSNPNVRRYRKQQPALKGKGRDAQRQAMGRRVAVQTPASTVAVKVTQREPDPAAAAAAKSQPEIIRERYNTAAAGLRERRLTRYLTQGDTAMAEGDYRAALAAFQQALRLAPEDQAVVARAEEASQRLLG